MQSETAADGHEADGGRTPDEGREPDAGHTPDEGRERDAGSTPDEGREPDAGHTPDDARGPDDDQVRAEGRRSASRTPWDMARSMIVLLVPVVIIVVLFRAFGHENVQVVDPGPALSEARAAAAFPVVEPSGLDRGWRPINANFQRAGAGATLRIGYVTPSGAGVQLIESSEPTATIEEREFGGRVQKRGNVDINGRQWYLATVRDGDSAVVLPESNRTIIVVGRATDAELTDLAKSLH